MYYPCTCRLLSSSALLYASRLFVFLLTLFSISSFFPLHSSPLLYLTIRLFLFSITPFTFIFFDQHCKSQNKVDLECYYEPISKCTIHDALKNDQGGQQEFKHIWALGHIFPEDMEKIKKEHESKKCFFSMCISSTNSYPFKIICFETCCPLHFLSEHGLFVLSHLLTLHSMHVDGTLKYTGKISFLYLFFFSVEKTNIFFLYVHLISLY